MLPAGILAFSALVALGIVLFEPSFIAGSSTEVAQRRPQEALSEPGPETGSEIMAGDPGEEPNEAAHETGHGESKSDEAAEEQCTDPSRTEYACYQERYQALVHGLGVEAPFTALRDELTKDDFVRSNCHRMTHVIGRAAEVYGDIPATYGRGDSFCGSGYYHAAMETIVIRIEADSVLEEANSLCADLGGREKYSYFHYNCVHGLGHGFMGIQENDLFESLETCDKLADEWERNRCYGGVFMENMAAMNNFGHTSRYLDAEEPLYPCDVVEDRYKDDCYQRQSSYTLETRGNDCAEIFGLCAVVAEDFQPSCYQDLSAACLQETEEYSASLQSPLERR